MVAHLKEFDSMFNSVNFDAKVVIFLHITNMTKVLVLEHSKSVRNNLVERLEFEGYTLGAYDSMDSFLSSAEFNTRFEMIITDTTASAPQCLELDIPFIIIPKSNSVEEASRAARCGAVEFIPRPVDMNRLLCAMRRMVTPADIDTPPKSSTRSKRCSISVDEMIGESTHMQHLKRLIEKVAPSEARVMILGENGTGKEMVARWIHSKSQRASSPFVEINCAAIPSELIESELFGHEKGAFTSAIKQRRGKFEQANGGTLFMDEIGDMSLSAQAKVLRVLQERKICRVGSDKDISVDVRVVAATNKNIRSEIARGAFREDLYHRIGVIELSVTPLRQRRDDIPLLIDHFLHQICAEYNISPCKSISKEAIEELKQREWSGNIRELRNIVERLVILSESRIENRDVKVYCLS